MLKQLLTETPKQPPPPIISSPEASARRLNLLGSGSLEFPTLPAPQSKPPSLLSHAGKRPSLSHAMKRPSFVSRARIDPDDELERIPLASEAAPTAEATKRQSSERSLRLSASERSVRLSGGVLSRFGIHEPSAQKHEDLEPMLDPLTEDVSIASPP